MVKAKVFVLQKNFDGFPKPTDLTLEEEELAPLKDGEFLLEAVYLSVDPYMRAYNKTITPGKRYIGTQIAKIIESKNPKFEVGQYIVGNFGWRSHTVVSDLDNSGFLPEYIWKDSGDVPLSYALGVLGMPGNTAYFGFLEICKPKPGETVVVSGAAGAVGSLVGQIAKIKGCKVIGITGSDEKGKWLVDELGFDHFINYKTQDIDAELTKVAPNGVDCYFDNVSGEITYTVLTHMNLFGRISSCGTISGYNEQSVTKVSNIQNPILFKQLRLEGFVVHRWNNRWTEGLEEMKKWVLEGKIKTRETITEGFENMFTAFTDMLQGKNTGKAIVKA